MTVSRETRLDSYLALLLRWGSALNLSSHGTSNASGFRAQIDESLALVQHLPAGLTRLIDLGSGQGFPAIPLAISAGIAIDLIESDRRKAAFLTTAMAQLGIEGHVLTSRIEATVLPPAMCITARALAPLPQLLTLARPFLTPDGCCLFLKGPAAAGEIAEATRTQAFVAEIFTTPSARANLVKITELR